MKLSQKGKYAPPPKLRSAAQKVSQAIAGWNDVVARTHWLLGDEQEVDGVDFYVGENEIGHIHLDSEAHIMLPRLVADALIKAGVGRRLEWSRAAVVFGIESPTEVDHALWLFRLSYDRRQGTSTVDLLSRVRDYEMPRARAKRA